MEYKERDMLKQKQESLPQSWYSIELAGWNEPFHNPTLDTGVRHWPVLFYQGK